MLAKYPHLTEYHHLLLLDITYSHTTVCNQKNCDECRELLTDALFCGYIEDGIFYYGTLTDDEI